jgi:hypothetical protein
VLKIGFLNRESELRALSELACSERIGAEVLFLRASSGLGKSSVVEQFFSNVPSLKAVRVPILARIGGERLDYLNHIVRQIDDYATRTHKASRFQQFLSWSGSPALAAETASRVLGRLATLVPGGSVATPIIQSVLKSEEFSSQAIMLRDKSFDLAATSSYIADFIADPAAALAVDNIQQIDDRSLLILLNIIQETRNGLWIFEYTEGVAGHPLDKLLERLRSTGANVRRMNLEPLPWEELRRSLDVQEHAVEPILREHYSRSKGNLRDFLDATRIAREGSDLETDNGASTATMQRLRRLPNDLAQIVALLAMHDGQVDGEILNQAAARVWQRMEFAERFDFKEDISKLVDQNILVRNRNNIEFAHDSVMRTAQELDEHERFRRIAAISWLALYREMRRRTDIFVPSAAVSSAILFYSYYLGDDAELFATLRQLTASSIEALAPARLVTYVETLYARIASAGQGDRARLHALTHHIISTLYRIWAFGAAEKLVGMLRADSDVARFYRIALAVEMDKSGEALAGCEAIINECRPTPKHPLLLATQLVRLAALRMTNQLVECSNEYHALRASGVFHNSPLNPYFLILSSTALPADEAVPVIKKGVELFLSSGSTYEANCGRITLSQCLGDLGRLEEASDALDMVETSGSSDREQYTVWNNRAVLNLYRKKVDDEILSSLRRASLLAVDPFSRLIILTNLMLTLTLREEDVQAQEAGDQIHRLLHARVPEENEIRRIAAFNLAFFYSKIGMRHESTKMTDMARKIPSQVNQPLWDYRFGKRTSVPDTFEFRIRFDYYPPMFAYWQLDVADKIES